MRTAHQDQAAIDRALGNWWILSAASELAGIDPALLAAIGVRESGFRNVRQVGGRGAGAFQIDMGQHPDIPAALALDVPFAAGWAALYLGANATFLAGKHKNFTPAVPTGSTRARRAATTGATSWGSCKASIVDHFFECAAAMRADGPVGVARVHGPDVSVCAQAAGGSRYAAGGRTGLPAKPGYDQGYEYSLRLGVCFARRQDAHGVGDRVGSGLVREWRMHGALAAAR